MIFFSKFDLLPTYVRYLTKKQHKGVRFMVLHCAHDVAGTQWMQEPVSDQDAERMWIHGGDM